MVSAPRMLDRSGRGSNHPHEVLAAEGMTACAVLSGWLVACLRSMASCGARGAIVPRCQLVRAMAVRAALMAFARVETGALFRWVTGCARWRRQRRGDVFAAVRTVARPAVLRAVRGLGLFGVARCARRGLFRAGMRVMALGARLVAPRCGGDFGCMTRGAGRCGLGWHVRSIDVAAGARCMAATRRTATLFGMASRAQRRR